jgi:hypothetical protein
LEKTWNSFSIAGNAYGETLADEVLPFNMKAAGPPWIFHKARDSNLTPCKVFLFRRCLPHSLTYRSFILLKYSSAREYLYHVMGPVARAARKVGTIQTKSRKGGEERYDGAHYANSHMLFSLLKMETSYRSISRFYVLNRRPIQL